MSADPMTQRLAMLRRIGGDTLISELIDLMLESTPPKLETMRTALSVGDIEQVGRLAHGLTSSAGNLGLADVQQAALDVEKCADGGGADLAELLDRLEQSWEQVRARLAQTKQGLST
jgi:HPt (histidine-containing phosphotransfer) domain-containing protein